MRPIAALVVLSLTGCTTPPSVPAAAPSGDLRALEDVRRRLATAELTADASGRLFEQEAELLLRLSKPADAAWAFDQAAAAYSHSPEGTGMPAINSARAARRAAEIRATLGVHP